MYPFIRYITLFGSCFTFYYFALNQALLDRCPTLKGYAMLSHYIRENQADGLELKKAVEQAIDRCIHEDFLKLYLLKKKAEVKLMLLTEFDQEAYERVIRKEEREEGQEEGEDRINRLHSILLDQNRLDDLKRAVKDRNYQAKLIKELLPDHMQATQQKI